jgi:hypothetical protein
MLHPHQQATIRAILGGRLGAIDWNRRAGRGLHVTLVGHTVRSEQVIVERVTLEKEDPSEQEDHTEV